MHLQQRTQEQPSPKRLFNARLSQTERAKLARIAEKRGTTSSDVLRQWIAETPL